MNFGEPEEEESISVDPSCVSMQGGAHSRVLAIPNQASWWTKQCSKAAEERGPACVMFPGHPGEAALEICPRSVLHTSHFLLWPYSPALKSDLGCMVPSVLLQSLGIPSSITTII